MPAKKWRELISLILVFVASRAAAEIMCVASRKANAREGAGTDHPVAWVADRYTPLRVLDWNGAWAMVSDVDGIEGWIHQSLLSNEPCVIMAGSKANVRAGPGLEHAALWEVETGYPFKVIGKNGDWLEVTDSGEVKGWIYVKLVWGKIESDGEV